MIKGDGHFPAMPSIFAFGPAACELDCQIARIFHHGILWKKNGHTPMIYTESHDSIQANILYNICFISMFACCPMIAWATIYDSPII